MQVPTYHIYLIQMLQMSNSSESELRGTGEIYAAKKEKDQLIIGTEMNF